MKNFIKFIIIVITITTLSSCSKEAEPNIVKYYSTGSVFLGDLDIKETAIGYIEGDKKVFLSTKLGGKVINVYKKEGDYVKKGEILVNLDSLNAKNGFKTSEDILNSLIKMKEYIYKSYDEKIISMEKKLNQVEIENKGLKVGVDDNINISKTQLERIKLEISKAEINLNYRLNILKNKENDIYDNSVNSIVNSIILNINILNFVDELLGITNKNINKNDNIKNYLSVKNTKYLIDSKKQFLEINKLYLEYKEFYDSKIEGKKNNKETILLGLKKGEELADKIKLLLDNVYYVLDNSIDNYYFTIDTINGYKNKVLDFGKNVELSLLNISGEYILGLKGSKQTLINFKEYRNMEIEILKKELSLIEKKYKESEIINNSSLKNKIVKSEISSSIIDEIKTNIIYLKKQKDISIKEIEIKINEIKGEKESALIGINGGKIIAPFNGVITSKIVEIGQVVNAGMPLIEVSSYNDLIINVNITDSLYENISLNDNVLLEIDGLNKQINGKITKILPSKDLITKKIGLEISFKNEGNNIKIGSFTKIIFNSSKNNSVLIPNSSIISKFMMPGVYILEKNKVIFKNIKILKQNDFFSKIDGLNIGEIIIIDGKENIWDGEILN